VEAAIDSVAAGSTILFIGVVAAEKLVIVIAASQFVLAGVAVDSIVASLTR
jgi:hypothetical protein